MHVGNYMHGAFLVPFKNLVCICSNCDAFCQDVIYIPIYRISFFFFVVVVVGIRFCSVLMGAQSS